MLLFPFYILYTNGWADIPIHNLNSGTTHYVNPLLIVLPLSIFGIGLSLICYRAAKRALKALNTKSDPYRQAGKAYRRAKAKRGQ